jgi:hypothetical protein
MTLLRNRHLVRTLAVSAALLTLSVPQSWAWGRDGHRITALVAESYLTPTSQAAIAELLHGQKIDEIASWADEVRSNRSETGPWHYVDIPRADATYDRMRDCPASKIDPASPWRDCVTDRILYFEGRLGDASLPPDQRAEALKFLVHFIGDIHQPFHAMGDDRGGNSVSVSFLGSTQCGSYKCNLHGVWDDSIIEHRGMSDEKYRDMLLKEIKANNWERLSGGTPQLWANVSHHYSVLAYAPNGALIDHKYLAAEEPVVDAELALGGLRLAHVLNNILGQPATNNEPGRIALPTPANTAPDATK